MELIKATEKDAGALAALINSAYRGESSKRGWTTEADLLDGSRTDVGLLLELIHKQNTVILRENKAAPRACVLLEKRGDSCYLGMLTVAPDEQASGLGSQLLAQAEAFAKNEWLCRQVEMTVISARLELIAWYERRGYTNTKVRSPFPSGNPRIGVPKVKSIDFELLVKDL